MIKRVYRVIMAEFSPELLLSSKSREECTKKLKDLPKITYGDKPPTLNAAVLVPLCVVDGEVNLLYTLRSKNLNSHKGEVSFPGGKCDAGETLTETALRETKEELGIPRDNIQIWTSMAEFQGANHVILITPIVGVIKQFDMSSLKPNFDEVSEVFTVPLSHFCKAEAHGHFLFKGIVLPVFLYKEYKIWGITALMTHLFLMNLLPENVYKGDNIMNKKYELENLIHKL